MAGDGVVVRPPGAHDSINRCDKKNYSGVLNRWIDTPVPMYVPFCAVLLPYRDSTTHIVMVIRTALYRGVSAILCSITV